MGDVEPDEPEQPVKADTGEQVGDLRGLVRGGHGGGLGDEDRGSRYLAHGRDGRPEQRTERGGRVVVVAVDADPGHVGPARPPPGRAGDLAIVRVVDDVDRPQPGHVLRPKRAEQADDVPPGRHEHRRGRFLVAPGVPVSVHLVAEAHDDRVAVAAHGPGVGPQVAVVPPGGDGGDADAVRVQLHDRHRAITGHGRGEASLEGLEPAAVVGHQARLDADGAGDRGHPGVGAGDPGRVPAEVGGGRRRQGEARASLPGRGIPGRTARAR